MGKHGSPPESIDRAHRDEADQQAARRGQIFSWLVAGLLGVAVVFGGVATIPGFPVFQAAGTVRIIIWIGLAAFFVL